MQQDRDLNVVIDQLINVIHSYSMYETEFEENLKRTKENMIYTAPEAMYKHWQQVFLYLGTFSLKENLRYDDNQKIVEDLAAVWNVE